MLLLSKRTVEKSNSLAVVAMVNPEGLKKERLFKFTKGYIIKMFDMIVILFLTISGCKQIAVSPYPIDFLGFDGCS